VKTKLVLGVAAVLLLAYKPWIVVLGLALVICVAVAVFGLMSFGWWIAERHDPVQELLRRDRRERWTRKS
jgi:hypothetical protein